MAKRKKKIEILEEPKKKTLYTNKLSEEQMEREIRGQKITMIFQVPQNALNPVFKIETQMTDILRVQDKYQNPGSRKRRKDFRQQAIERGKARSWIRNEATSAGASSLGCERRKAW